MDTRRDLQITRQLGHGAYTTQQTETMSNREEEDEDERSSIQDAAISFETHALSSEAPLWPQFGIDGHFSDIPFIEEIGQQKTGSYSGGTRSSEIRQLSEVSETGPSLPKAQPKIITISLPPVLQDTPRRSEFGIDG